MILCPENAYSEQLIPKEKSLEKEFGDLTLL